MNQEKCICTLRERLVGDGCYVCNPEYAEELAKEARMYDKDMMRYYKKEINSPKERLMEIRDRIREVDLKQAEMLDKIIGKLEHFQNK